MERRVYFDHVSACPVDQRVLDAMLPSMRDEFGNPSSINLYGFEAKKALDAAREHIVSLIGAALPEELVFTSGATESNNMALKGVAYRNRKKGKRIVVGAAEHISIINAAKYLKRDGYEVIHVPVDADAKIDLGELEKAVNEETTIVSVSVANNEVGTIQPLKEVAEIAHDAGAYLHADAVAAAGRIPLDVDEPGVDLLTLSSNDMYGPRGVGALYLRDGTMTYPLIQGGGQERGLRSGTENVAGIVGFGEAARIARRELPSDAEKMRKMRDRIIEGVMHDIEDVVLNGHPTDRTPHNANLRFAYVEGEAILLHLTDRGIATATSSACSSKTLEPSHVLLAMGIDHASAQGALLLSVGRFNTYEDVDYLLKVLPGIIQKLREMSPLYKKADA